jgi:hypothetical protein
VLNFSINGRLNSFSTSFSPAFGKTVQRLGQQERRLQNGAGRKAAREGAKQWGGARRVAEPLKIMHAR